MDKRGISGLLVSILVLLVAIVAIFLISSFLNPTIEKSLSGTSCVDLINGVSFEDNGYTCFGGNFTSFSVQVGSEVTSFAVVISENGVEKRYDIFDGVFYKDLRMGNGDFGDSLSVAPGDVVTYVFEGVADSIKLFPIAKEGFLCSLSDQIILNQCSQSSVQALQSVAGGGGGGGGGGGDDGGGPGGPSSFGLYGSGVAMDSLANTHAGSPDGVFVLPSIGFVAEHTANFTSFYFHHAGGVGYANGTGGIWRAEIYENDPLTNTPTGPILSSKVMPPINYTLIEEVVLDNQVPIVKGKMYHILFRNIDPLPQKNYFSVDNVYVHNPDNETFLFPKYHPDKLIHQYFSNNTWKRRLNHLPILEVSYEDGFHQGMSYDEIQYGNGVPGQIGGVNNLVRETVNVSGGDKIVSGVGIRLLKTFGTTSPLVVKIKDSNGNEISSMNIPASFVSTGPQPPASCSCTSCDCIWNAVGQYAKWTEGNFSQNVVLSNSQKYYLEFSSQSGDYWAWSIRHYVNMPGFYQPYPFHNETAFVEGYSQKTVNGGVNWTYLANPGNQGPMNDLQFYFVTN